MYQYPYLPMYTTPENAQQELDLVIPNQPQHILGTVQHPSYNLDRYYQF